MDIIKRSPELASKKTYDLIIVGGGVYGVMLAFEASRRRQNVLLLEQDDFGGHTSYNSLKIIHGGFRYLQDFDLRRLFESIFERRFFLKNFPEIVNPLPCLMPLYGRGLRRPFVLRAALAIYDILSLRRNIGVSSEACIPGGRIIKRLQIKEIFPQVDLEELKAGAVWHDALMSDSQRLIIEVLRCACANGSTALNYVKAAQLLKRGNKVEGVKALDRENNKVYEYKSGVVINSAGPWCREVAESFDKDIPALFTRSLAWNVFFSRKAISSHGLAVAPKIKGGQTYFLVPWKGKLLAGTGHASCSSTKKEPIPSEKQLQQFLDDINLAVPGLKLTQKEIIRVLGGFQPAAREGSEKLATRELIVDHFKKGGPQGLYSVSGVKFTTARLVAEKTLIQIFPKIKNNPLLKTRNQEEQKIKQRKKCTSFDFEWFPDPKDLKWKKELSTLATEESVLHLDDLIFRRTSIGDNPTRALALAPTLCALFPWDDSRCSAEIAKVERRINLPHSIKEVCPV